MTLTTSIINPKLITLKDRDILVEKLYEAHNQIFDGVDKDEFTKYVIDSKAHSTQIFIQKNKEQIIGYGAIHLYKFDTFEERLAVVRMEVGFLPEYRKGNNKFHLFAISQILQFLIQSPNRKLYFLGSLVHPSSYVALTNLSKDVWPTVENYNVIGKFDEIIKRLSDIFEFKPVNHDNPHVVKVGWKTRETASNTEHKQPLKSSAQFYLQQNPNYRDGHGLITIIPINLKIITLASVALAQKKQTRLIGSFLKNSRTKLLTKKQTLPKIAA
jgi:hypothetical protein